MYVWVSILTERSVGFGLAASDDPKITSIAVDSDIYQSLLQDPNKIRWGRLLHTGSKQELTFKVPAPASYSRKYAKVSVEFSDIEPPKATDVTMVLDAKGSLTVDCAFDLANSYLAVCPSSVFLPALCQKVHLGYQGAKTLRKLLLGYPNSQVFLSNVSSHWTVSLSVQTRNKGH